MCTLSAVRPLDRETSLAAAHAPGAHRGGVEERRDRPLLRVMFNRDEARARPVSLPPETMRCRERLAIYPVDPQSGGTWIGVNDAGLVGAILNASATFAGARKPGDPPRPPAERSRGLILPRVLEASNLVSAIDIVRELEREAFKTLPFRLWLSDAGEHVVCVFDGRRLAIGAVEAFDRPLMLASSSLGDELVLPTRREAFEQELGRGVTTRDAQERVHACRDLSRGELGVLMSRADARTVSRTTLEMHASFAELRCETLDDALVPVGAACSMTLAFRESTHSNASPVGAAGVTT